MNKRLMHGLEKALTAGTIVLLATSLGFMTNKESANSAGLYLFVAGCATAIPASAVGSYNFNRKIREDYRNV